MRNVPLLGVILLGTERFSQSNDRLLTDSPLCSMLNLGAELVLTCMIELVNIVSFLEVRVQSRGWVDIGERGAIE